MCYSCLDVFKSLVCYGADPTLKNRFGDSVFDYPGDYELQEVQAVVDAYISRSQDAAGQ